jgi:hypothetical protein
LAIPSGLQAGGSGSPCDDHPTPKTPAAQRNQRPKPNKVRSKSISSILPNMPSSLGCWFRSVLGVTGVLLVPRLKGKIWSTLFHLPFFPLGTNTLYCRPPSIPRPNRTPGCLIDRWECPSAIGSDRVVVGMQEKVLAGVRAKIRGFFCARFLWTLTLFFLHVDVLLFEFHSNWIVGCCRIVISSGATRPWNGVRNPCHSRLPGNIRYARNKHDSLHAPNKHAVQTNVQRRKQMR